MSPCRHHPGRAFVVNQRPGKNAMKLVIAIIKPFKLDEVRDALMGLDVTQHGEALQ
jgi:hypothetical protein